MPARPRTRTTRITRATIAEPVVASETTVVHGVKLGVVALATFSPGAHAEVREAVETALHHGARGIVLDLRDNGGGLVEEAQLIASIFIPKGTIVTTRGRTQPTPDAAARPATRSRRRSRSSCWSTTTRPPQRRSSRRRCRTIAARPWSGTHTFGKGVFQEEEPLSNGGAIDITVGEYFTPDGRNLGGGGVKQGAGITPEVLVPNGVDTTHGLDVALNTLAAKVR